MDIREEERRWSEDPKLRARLAEIHGEKDKNLARGLRDLLPLPTVKNVEKAVAGSRNLIGMGRTPDGQHAILTIVKEER